MSAPLSRYLFTGATSPGMTFAASQTTHTPQHWRYSSTLFLADYKKICDICEYLWTELRLFEETKFFMLIFSGSSCILYLKLFF